MGFRRKKSKVYIDEKGYKRYKDSNTPVHRHVAEQKLGRKLRPGEVVHHKNRDKKDNRRKNLWVFPNKKAHHEAHKKDNKRYGRW
ncbi:MAG: HNH endonuclease [Candidatus Kariarchaeaceae archaeon]|jgi:hypothetical protein